MKIYPAILMSGIRQLVLICLVVLFSANAFAAHFDSGDRREIEKIIQDYLIENPQIMLKVFERLEELQAEEESQMDLSVLTIHRKDLERDGYSYVAGNPDGDVTIVEFFDYRCTFCKRSMPEVEAVLAADSNVRLVLKEFPILGPDSTYASRVAIAALKQPDKYLPFHTAMLSHRGNLTKTVVLKIAENNGIDITQLKADLNDPTISEQIKMNMSQAEALRINGTPTFIVGDTVLRGAVDRDRLFAEIAAARKSCQSC